MQATTCGDTSERKIDASVERLHEKIDQKTDEGKQHTSLLFEAAQTEMRALAENVASIGERVDGPGR